MKKRILFISLMVALFVCLFVISASAATIYKDASGNELFRYVDENADYDFDSYTGSFPKTDSEGNALTWYITATTTDGGNTVHTVASLKTLGEAGSINGSGAYSFTSPVTNKNTVSVNFPDNSGIKTWAFNSFGGYNTRANNNILFVYCPNTLTAFANNPFQETPVIVVELDDETPVTSIPQNFAHEARNLEAINIPATVTVINGDSGKNGAPFYRNYSLVNVTFASQTNLKELKHSCFNECTSLVTISLPDSVQIIGNYVFANCKAIKEIKLPNSLIKISDHVFSWCDSIEVIRMGASFAYFNNTGDNSFTYTTGKVKEIYIPKTFYATAPDTSLGYQVSYAFHGASANCKFFYCGSVSDFATAKANFLTQKSATSNNGAFLNAEVITYTTYLSDLEKYSTGRYVICGYNTCDAFYDSEHVLDPEKSNDCAGVCKNCLEVSQATNPVHVYQTTITYADYTKAGIKTMTCSNANCQHNVTPVVTELEAIFEYLGFSLKADMSGSICLGYAVNSDAREEYEQHNSALSFGVVGYIPKANESPLKIQDGSVTAVTPKYTVLADVSQTEYNAFDFLIAGFDGNTSVALVMCAYVCNGTDLYYLNVDKSTNEMVQSKDATTFSYDDLYAYKQASGQ